MSKIVGEHYTALYARLHGLRTAALRLFPVYGPRLRRHVVHDLIAKILASSSDLVIEGDGRQQRDLTYVTDAVSTFLLAADRAPLRGEVYNVGSGRTLSIRQLAQCICERMHVRPRLSFSMTERPGLARCLAADISRLRGLGYRPLRTDRGRTGRTIAWLRREVGRATLATEPGSP